MNTLWRTCWRWPWTPCDPAPTWGWGQDVLQQLQPASQVGEGHAYTVTLCNTVWHYVTQHTHQRRQTGRPSEAIASVSGWRWTCTQCDTVWHYTHLGRRTGQPSATVASRSGSGMAISSMSHSITPCDIKPHCMTQSDTTPTWGGRQDVLQHL